MPVAFVSGASQGIGYAIALRLADDGFDIAVNDLPSKDASDVVHAIEAKGSRAISAPADVTSMEEVEAAIGRTVTELGGIDVMIANAGIGQSDDFLELSSERFDRMMAINVKGVFNCYQVAARQMVKQGRGGRLIAASSLAGKKGQPRLSAYSASKFAVRGLTQSVAIDLAKHGITANCYCPGYVDTPMIANARERLILRNANNPIPGLGSVEHVAHVVSFLASDKASFITGQSLSSDGGETMS